MALRIPPLLSFLSTPHQTLIPTPTQPLFHRRPLPPPFHHPQTPSPRLRLRPILAGSGAPLDLTEDNILQVLLDARTEFAQIFDTSVGMTGVVDLAELDGPYVTLRLKGRFWHTRATVLARLSNYLKIRIPEILEVDIEDEKQLDDSPENF